MAADKRKKQLNAASLIDCTSSEQHSGNRKKLKLPQYNLNMRSNISLAWDSKKKGVVSMKEQIGISRRHFLPFIGDGPRGSNILADVCLVPKDIFDLGDLSKVLSYEVWKTHLCDDEQSLLSQFLPKGSEPDEIIQELLAGTNFHFGNLFQKWGDSLCFGKLHPDNILHEEQSIKASKMAYFSDLQKYHKDMIENLQVLKERWASFKDPGKGIVQKIWRSEDNAGQSMPPSDAIFCNSEENLVLTPESCSWSHSEKAHSSDNQKLLMMSGESKRRKGSLDRKYDNFCNWSRMVARPKKGEKLHKHNIHHCDGAKYMSYIKVSKEQHQRVKSTMKLTCNSIHPRSLNKVLGDINVHVQPFEVFEEEERKKLHEYWLQLANKDMPEGFTSWRKRQLQRQHFTHTLGQELGQKLKHLNAILDEEKEDSYDTQPMVADDSKEEILPITTVNDEAIHEMATEIEGEKEKNDYLIKQQPPNGRDNIEDDDKSGHIFIQDHHQQHISLVNHSPRFTPMVESRYPGYIQDQHQEQIAWLKDRTMLNSLEMESHGHNSIVETDEDATILPGCPRNQNHVDVSVGQVDPLASAIDVWPAVNMHGSYYLSTSLSDKCASASEMPHGHLELMEQPVRMMDLATDRQDKAAEKDMLNGDPDDMSLFSAYPNEDRNELLQSFFKGQGSSPYQHEENKSQLYIQPSANLMVDAGSSSRHFTEQTRLNDLYMHQNIQQTMYTNNGDRYTVPRQEQPVNVHNWMAVNTVCMSAPSQSHLNGGALSQNWYSGERETRGGWSTIEGAVGLDQNISSGSNSDQSLYSVLTECDQLRRGATSNSMEPQQFIQAGDYGGMGGVSSIGLQQSPNPLNSLSGCEASAGLKINSLGWTGIQQQNSGLQYMRKPFLKSWYH